MSDVAIRVEGLSKQYRIGGPQARYKTLRESLVSAAQAPIRRAGRLLRGEAATDHQETIWALKDVSFEVKHGEVLGIIGRNGAGKSTLLKILSRITAPTEGTVDLYGRVGSLLEVGTGFHPELTGRENIYLNGAILGMKRAEIDRKFDEIVAFAELEKFLDTSVKHYSSGMYVRLAFAVAAHLDPEILMVDEVLAVGDAAFQKKCLGKMGEVAGEGRTVLFVSHNMGAISEMCQRAVCLCKGTVQEAGAAGPVVANYLSRVFHRDEASLDDLRLAGMGNRVRFRRIGLVSEIENSIRFGQPLRFHLEIESMDDLDHLTIGSSVFSLKGECVGSLITPTSFSVQKGKTSSLRLRIEGVTLAPGNYYSGFSIGTGGYAGTGRHDHEAIIGVPAFQVLPLSDNDQDPVSHWNPGWGSIVFRDVELEFHTTNREDS